MLFDSIEIDLLQDSNREMITDSRMAIKGCILTEATINEYLGKEIKGFMDAGFEPERRYKVYRPLEEIEKVLLQYNGLDLIDDHHTMNGLKTNRKFAVGATGESAILDGNKVLNTVFVTDKDAIQDIEMATKSRGQYGKRCLSCSYDYTPIFEKGVFDGKQYDVRIIDLKLDHVALVQEGRVQSAQIADSNNLLKGVKNMNFEVMKTALKGLFGIETANDSQIEQLMVFSDKAKDNEEKPDKNKDPKDDMDDSEEEKEKKEKEIKDNEAKEKEEEEKAKAKDNEVKEKEQKECIKDAISKELKEIRTIHSLCTKVIGTLSDTALALDKEVLLNDTLKTLKQNTDGKSYDMQKVMLETLANANNGTKVNNRIVGFSDSKTTTNNNSFVYTIDDINKLGSKK